MYSGRTQKEKDRLAEAITEDVVKILKVKREEVIVVFTEAFMKIGMLLVFVYKEQLREINLSKLLTSCHNHIDSMIVQLQFSGSIVVNMDEN